MKQYRHHFKLIGMILVMVLSFALTACQSQTVVISKSDKESASVSAEETPDAEKDSESSDRTDDKDTGSLSASSEQEKQEENPAKGENADSDPSDSEGAPKYIDESYVDETYGAQEEEDLGKYHTSGNPGMSGQTDSSASNNGDSTVDNGNGTSSNLSDGSRTEKDQYGTDPVPEGRPNPVEPADAQVDKNTTYSCTLYVECSTILNNMGNLTSGKDTLVPSNGIIYGPKTVSFSAGESVYDVLLREMQNNRIHMDSEFTPAYNSVYVLAINNLYEKDCGSLSGWTYCVNGWYPNYGCSRYQLNNGDTVEWHYTCDLGRDLGADISTFQ